MADHCLAGRQRKGSVEYSWEAETDVGKVRSNNEDSLLVEPELGLFGVCDGLGGHAAGEVASSLAVASLSKELQGLQVPPAEALARAIEVANQRILAEQARDTSRSGMGTTLTALWLAPEGKGMGWVAHVGDSRLYRLRGGGITQLTDDHSPVYRLFKEGRISRSEMRGHPRKNLIDRCLGSAPQVQPDIFPLELQEGDWYLVCSDGLTDSLEDEEIARLLTTEGVRGLIRAANDRGGWDNTSVVLIRITALA